MTTAENVHHHEIHKFGSQAERWWDPQGEFKTLHDINPLRIRFIRDYTNIEEKRANNNRISWYLQLLL